MVSESDILEALRNSPTLKGLLDLPARVAELERRLGLLQDGAEPKVPRELACLFCGQAMRITAEIDHPVFASLGMKKRTLMCDSCRRATMRDYQPSNG